jgi:hypothetical protein
VQAQHLERAGAVAERELAARLFEELGLAARRHRSRRRSVADGRRSAIDGCGFDDGRRSVDEGCSDDRCDDRCSDGRADDGRSDRRGLTCRHVGDAAAAHRHRERDGSERLGDDRAEERRGRAR